MYEEIINKMVDKKSVRKKSYKKLSLREKVLSLVVEANKNAPLERRVIPRSALTVMARAEKRLSALSGESKELGVLREVSNFITAHVDTFKAYEYSVNTDLLPVGHPKAISNLSASANIVREKYANWLSSDPMLDDSVRSLVASAHSLEPGTVERKHAFARLRVTRAGSTPTFFKIDSLTALVAAFSFSGGNSSAARRARVALQWRDRKGRWVEMGRGLDFNFRLPNGDIASAGGTYVGVNAARGYSTENGKPVANAGLVEVRGNPNIPDGIYSIESPNATPVKARVPGEALRRAKVKATPSVRKPTAEESQSKDIPNLDDLLKTRVDAPSGWRKQTDWEKVSYGDDGSFISDDNYKAIPNKDGGYSLHRLDKDGKTGTKVADTKSWAEVQAAAEKDSDDYEKFKQSATILNPNDDYKVNWARPELDEYDQFDDVSTEKSIEAFITANNLDGRVSLRSVDDSGYEPEVVFNIPDEAKDDFARAYEYDDWNSLVEDIEKVDFESENRQGVEGARAAQKERLAESIFNRRTEGGESLEEVAEDLGMTREQVRKIESEYARKNGLGRQDRAVDEVKQELDKIFADTPKVDYALWAEKQNSSEENNIKYPELPKGTLLLTKGNSNNIVRYPDGSYAVSAPEGDADTEEKGTHTFRRLEDLDTSRDYTIYDENGNEVSATEPEVVLWSVGPNASPDFGGQRDSIVTSRDALRFPPKVEANYRKADINAELLRAGFLLPTYFPTPGGQRNLLARRDRDPNYEMPPADEVLRVANMRGNPRKLVVTVRSLETGEERKFGINKNSKLYDVRVPEAPREIVLDEPPTPPTPPTPPSGASGESRYFGNDYGDRLVDAANSVVDIDNSITENFFDDDSVTSQEAGESLADEIFDHYGDQFDLSKDIADDMNSTPSFYDTFNKKDFINSTVSKVLERVSDEFDSAAADSDELPEHVDKKEFMNALEEKLRSELDDFVESALVEYNDLYGDDEPPTPPSPGGGVPPKVPSPSSPSTPGLFKEFDVPAGAFQLRTVDYEPDGRVDEESTDFTDDPSVIATKYPLAVIINAFTESLIGEKDDSVLSDIVDSSIDDDEEPLNLEDIDNVVDTSVTPAGRANGTGAGSLEFNAGAEFVPAEALYNAIFLAGGDPNRVIANAYDAVNGNRNNLDRLHNAAGGVPDAEEAKLVDDIFQEIGQIKDASTPEEIEQKAASPIEGADEDKPLPGELIYNVPVNFDNPDYYDIDSNPYPPTLEEPDEFGFTDNPEYIARNFAEADLLEQFEIAITDGTGVINLVYNDEVPLTEGTYQVPAEAVRDALQLQGINTNDVLERIRDESNDFEDDEEAVTPQPEETATESSEASMDGAIDSMRNYYPLETLLRDIKPLMYLPADGSIAFKDAWDDLMIARPGGVIQPLNVTEDWLRDPNGAGQAGWRDLTDAEKRAILGTSESAPAETTPETTPEPQRFQYPGPKEPGYSPNNTTLVLGGTGGSAAERAVVGKGARVLATKDNKLGTVVAIQNDPEYVRIRFDDGTTAVRSATKVRAVSDGGGQVPQVVTREDSPPSQDVAERLNRPLLPAPRLARSGETLGVNDESSRPEILEGKTKEDAVQSDFSSWGTRDAEIAKAAVDRVSLDILEQEAYKYHLAREKRDSAAEREALDSIKALLGDAYGDRQGVSFGGEFFSMRVKNVTPVVFRGRAFTPATEADINNGKASTTFDISLDILDVSGNVIGRASRSVRVQRNLDKDNNLIGTSKTASALYLVISDGKKKQKGFGSAYNRWVENWYIANGIEKVKVGAAGGGVFQGGFVWALNGYNWQNADDADDILRQLQRKVSNSLEESQVEYLSTRLRAAKRPDGSYDMGLIPTPIEFALVGWDPEKNPEKETWLGKKIMVQNSWNGVKSLTPSAREQVQAVNYNQIRSARGRVLSKQNMPNVSSEGLTVIESNEFRNSPTIAPYYSQIRDALRNNRSLAVLSPDAKNALNDYVSQQMLLSGSKASLPLEDAFQLRSGLINEYRADYGYSDPFNSAEALSTFKVDDFYDASATPDKAKLTEAGFKVRSLQDAERGVNATFEVTHVASGQVFYVKNDTYVTDYSSTLAGVTELESSIILRAAGMQGIHEVRVGKNDENLVIMSRAGSSIPLQDEAVNAYVAFRRGIKNTKGINTIFSPQDFINDLDNPEDLVRMSILDILGSNEDRHNGNWMIAFDKGTGKLRIFPVDNTIGELRTDDDSMADYINSDSLMEADVYNDYMPALVNSVGSVGMLKMYENEIDNIVKNLDNPLYQPKGFEMDKIIQKWGSYDAFKDAMSARLKKLVTKDTQEYNALKNVLRVGYWN